MYLEYIERCRLLVNDADVPQMDHKWLWVLREGTLAKAWEYKQNEPAALQHFQIYQQGLLMMKAQDLKNLDYVPVMEARQWGRISSVTRYADSVSDAFPLYGVGAR